MQQALSMLAFLAGVALVLIGVIKLFQLISRRVTRHSLRFGALLLAALLLLAATLSYDQLRENLGALGGPARGPVPFPGDVFAVHVPAGAALRPNRRQRRGRDARRRARPGGGQSRRRRVDRRMARS